jgi:hypothetical protein
MHEYGSSFHLLVSSPISSVLYSFHCKGLSPPELGLFFFLQ